MKKFVLAVVLLLVVGAVGGYMYISNVDWNQHKEKIAEQFYNSTGKQISFEGRVAVKLFPSPYISASNVKIYNGKHKAENPLLDVNTMTAEIALSPLLKGEIDIKRMELDGVKVNIDWDNGGLNWQTDLSPDQRQMMEDAKMVLNSVSLKNAEINIEAKESGFAMKLANLTGVVAAESVFGPFRIEGNYLKGNSPQGFVVTVGKLSESFATTLNAVVTNPQSESYVRFDGNFHLGNKVLNGNVIVESKKIANLINDNINKKMIDDKYNIPIAMGFDIMLNPQSLNMSNIVVKYGSSQGAGVFQMPLKEEDGKKVITAKFDFADLNLDPLVDSVKGFVEKYRESEYLPDYEYDVNAEVKALRASYNNQGLKNFNADVSVVDNVINVDDLSVVLPGDTNVKLKGSIYSEDDTVFYQAGVEAAADDLSATMNWLDVGADVIKAGVYKKMVMSANFAGNLDKVQVSPFKLSLDKTTFEGEAGIILNKRKDIMVIVNADTINLDNYISQLPDEEKSKSWAERMKYRFAKLGVLNDFDMVLDAKAGLIIYEGMPFEKIDVKASLLNGVMDVEHCTIGQLASSAMKFSGKLNNFGNEIQMDNLQFEVNSSDVASFINKFELKVPDLDYSKFNNGVLAGAINGTFGNFATNSKLSIGQLNASYEGLVNKGQDGVLLDGNISFKHPELARLLSNLRVKYVPQVNNLGIVNVEGSLKGNLQQWQMDKLRANVGFSLFEGNLKYDKTGERPLIETDLKINKFEIEKYLVRSNAETVVNVAEQGKKVEFLPKPVWNRNVIDYDLYKLNDVNANIEVGELSYKNKVFKDSKFSLKVMDGVANISDFAAVYNNAPLTGQMTLNMKEKNDVSVVFNIPSADVNDFYLKGGNWGLSGGKFGMSANLNSKAASEFDFVSNLSGYLVFSGNKVDVDGIDLQAIHQDLLNRRASEGLSESVKKFVGNGRSEADDVKAKLAFDKGAFTFENTKIKTPMAVVTVSGDGNLESWDAEVLFDVKYNEPQYLPGFSFSFKNGLDNPAVDVDVSPLFKFYKGQEDQREADRVAEIEKERQEWQDKVEQQKKRVDDLVLETRNKLEKDLELKREVAFGQQAIVAYEQLRQEIAKTLAQLVEKTSSVKVEDKNEDVLVELEKFYQQSLADIERYRQQIDSIYLADLKDQNEAGHMKVVDAYNEFKQNVFAFNSEKEKFKERLYNVMSEYNANDDAELSEVINRIESETAKVEELNGQIAKLLIEKDRNLSANLYEEENLFLADSLKKIEETTGVLVKDFQSYKEHVVKKVEEAEVMFAKKQEEEENKRKIEENTGSISIKKTGQTKTIVRDIEDIKNTEEKISSEDVKVLDFTKENPTGEKSDNKPVNGVIKRGKNIITN